MSPTSRAYAALTQQWIRQHSKLPAWDKRKVGGRGWGPVKLWLH
jgi:hypothetical protein